MSSMLLIRWCMTEVRQSNSNIHIICLLKYNWSAGPYYIYPCLYSASHSMILSEELPITAIDTVSEFTRRRARYRQL